MHPRFSALISLLTVWGLAPAVQAGLEFEQPVQKASVKIEDAEIGTKFKFRVTGDKPVKIIDIRTFCSCVRAQTLDGKLEYKPGETGTIDAAFEVGGFEGELKKEVVITTDDAAAPESRLVLEVSIPPLFQITPAQLIWKVGEPAEAKVVSVKVLGDKTVNVTAAVSSRDTVTTAVKQITEGKEYEITVKPSVTDAKLLGLVRIETNSPYPRYQKRLIFFNITDKVPPPGAPGGPPAVPAAAPSPAAAAATPAAAAPASAAPVPAAAAPAARTPRAGLPIPTPMPSAAGPGQVAPQ